MLNFEMFEILMADEVQNFSVHHLPNFVVVFQATAEIWRFFSNGGRPHLGFLKI